jgi:hypothetical protein
VSAASIISTVRRLQKIQADRLNPPTKKSVQRGLTEADRLQREAARLQAARSGRRAPLFPEYRDDPISLATELLGVRLCRAQRRILEAIARGKRVAIRSGQKLGKSTAFVIAALWWAATRPRGRVLFTAPVNKQIKEVLWKELRRILYDEKARSDGKCPFEVLGVEPALQPATGMQWPDGREIVGFTADSPNSMQGFSGPEMLIIVDEGSGVGDDIFEAIEGNTAAGGSILAASNPTETIGWFFEAFHSQREFWDGHHLSCLDSPNVTGDEPPIPGLADKQFCADMLAKHGESSSFYQTRVLGNFAGTAANAVVGLAAIEAAQERWLALIESKLAEPLELGVDVARFGDDDSAIAPRRGLYAYPIVTVSGFDTVAVAGKVIEVARLLRRSPTEKVSVKVDTSGGYGAGVADLLRAEYPKELDVHDVSASEKADDAEVYVNKRAQLHFAVAEWLTDGGALPQDKPLEVELLAPRYSYDARGRRKIESKDEIKKRIGRSPDRADALALSIVKVAPRVRATGAGSFQTHDFERSTLG